ncbi:ACP phosphodiesterase [Congregibacter sp.]|uniref:acyl carrier protein phosphodiesterase n=1 Tax=Congregibacter sp. TaxID=2744308 RepID=UPI0039E6AF7B
MNYLAHALLAEPYAHSLIGNIAGDLVKGPLSRHALHPRVADGVRRHRRVDTLTDRHSAYLALKTLFPSGYRRYAGLVLDVLFDHYLVQHWHRYSNWSRDAFLDDTYAVLRNNPQLLPEGLAVVASRWVDADWLRVYETREGVAAVLERLSQRLSRPVDLVALLQVADEHADEFEAGFLEVFTDVQLTISY